MAGLYFSEFGARLPAHLHGVGAAGVEGAARRGDTGLGISPVSRVRSTFSPPMVGIAEMSAFV